MDDRRRRVQAKAALRQEHQPRQPHLVIAEESRPATYDRPERRPDEHPASGRMRGYRSVEAASVELGLAEITIYRAITAGHIAAAKINRNWRIPATYFDDLEREAYSHLEQHSPAWEASV